MRGRLAATEGLGVPCSGDGMLHDPARDPVPAAVLIAITDRPSPGLILTQRPDSMRHHAGQVALPGGRIDPGDKNAVDAALREAEEEIALPRACVAIVGAIEPYLTVTGFSITPVVGIVPATIDLVPDQREVAAVFEVPLDHVLAPGGMQRKHAMFAGRERSYFEVMWGERRIWGATAAILVNLAHRLQW